MAPTVALGGGPSAPELVPCLWFDDEAEAFARWATSVIPGSRIVQVSHYPETIDNPGGKARGSVLTVEFELAGQRYTALNGGPNLRLDEAFSIQVMCKDQAEIDHYWDALVEGGGEHGPCGWLKDRFGVSWQVAPADWLDLVRGGDQAAYARVFQAMLGMAKFDIASLKAAARPE